MEGGTTAVVPTQRLAELLAEARRRDEQDLATLAARSDGRFDEADLAAIEAGTTELDDETVRAVVELYGVDPGEFAPERSALVIDLHQRRLRAGSHEEPLGAPTADEVLATYLSLLYTMRHAAPGTELALRDADVSVLSRVLELTAIDVERRLHHLMADPDDEVGRRHRWLRRRVLVPAAGVLIAVTAVGSLVLVNRSDVDTTVPPTPTTVATTTDAPTSVTDGSSTLPVTPSTGATDPSVATTPDVSLIPPVVQERNPDGSPGPQVTVEAQIGDALVMERNPDGSAGPQVARR